MTYLAEKVPTNSRWNEKPSFRVLNFFCNFTFLVAIIATDIMINLLYMVSMFFRRQILLHKCRVYFRDFSSAYWKTTNTFLCSNTLITKHIFITSVISEWAIKIQIQVPIAHSALICDHNIVLITSCSPHIFQKRYEHLGDYFWRYFEFINIEVTIRFWAVWNKLAFMRLTDRLATRTQTSFHLYLLKAVEKQTVLLVFVSDINGN